MITNTITDQKSSLLHKEVADFLDNLHYLKIADRIIAIGKDVPCLFEFLPDAFLLWKDTHYISDKLIKDFFLLRKFGYIPKAKISQKPLVSLAGLDLHISHDCNMACKYCFVKEGISRSKVKLMSPEIARKAVNFFYNSIDQNVATVTFLGGEPLLNLPAIEAVSKEVKTFSNYDTKLIIATNGTLLNREIAQFLHRNKIQIIISYDGIKEEHDRNRRLKDGGGSSQLVLNSINLLNELGIEIEAIKTTIAQDSPYSLMDYVNSLMKLPIHPRKFRFQYEYSFPPKPWRKGLIAQRLDFFDKLKYWMEQGKKFKDLPLDGSLDEFHSFVYPHEKTFGGCGFGQNKVLVTPDGNFYFCDLVINMEDFYVGNIEQGVDKDKLAALEEKYFLNLDCCKDCWTKSFCDYHCPHVRIDKACLADRCVLSRAESKKKLEIFLGLNLEDISSLYIYSSIPERLKRTVTKLVGVGYRIRSILQERTAVLKPLNILPCYSENA